MKLSLLAQETLANIHGSPVPLHVDELLKKSTITKYSRRLNAAVLDLESKGLIYLVLNPESITQYGCEYGVRGLHDVEE
jgi:hypothetical protein